MTVIRVSDEISSNFLFAYLASPTGQSQIKREITGATGQQHLLKSKVARILVPALPDVIEPKLRRAVQEAHQRQESRRIAYEEAEALLESELALDTLDLKRRLFFDRSYRSILDAERFDAEFFQPRVQNLMMTLARGEKRLGDVATLSKRRFKPKAGKKFNYIEIGDLSDTGIAESTSILGENAPSRAAWVVEPGDIITTTVRPIRRLTAMIIKGQSGYVCSSGFAVLRPSSEIAPEVLLVYLRLPLVAELLDLHTTASMYPAIATADLVRIPISLPDKSTQNKIVAAIKRSINSQREARQYLDEAKQIVERAVLGE